MTCKHCGRVLGAAGVIELWLHTLSLDELWGYRFCNLDCLTKYHGYMLDPQYDEGSPTHCEIDNP